MGSSHAILLAGCKTSASFFGSILRAEWPCKRPVDRFRLIEWWSSCASIRFDDAVFERTIRTSLQTNSARTTRSELPQQIEGAAAQGADFREHDWHQEHRVHDHR